MPHVSAGQLQPVAATPWRWPWRFRLIERIELAPDDAGEST
jgi:hypothetical protein